MVDDAELLRRYARENSEEAFAELVRRYLGIVFHVALRQLGPEAHAASDVSQKVFTLLARKASALSAHENLAGWLHTTARFTARETLRTERRRRAREQEAQLMHELSTHSDSPDWQRLRPVIDDALGQLNASDREAVLLRFFAGLPLAEIGARLRVTENAARMRIDRALEKLRAQLGRRGVVSTSAALAALLAQQSAFAAPAGLAASVTTVALAGATASGAGAVLALSFMSLTKFQIGLGLAAALLIGAAVFEADRAHRLQAEKAAAASDRAALAQNVAQLDQHMNAARVERSRLTAEIARLRATPAVASAGAATNASSADTLEALRERFRVQRELERTNPDFQRVQMESRKLGIAQDYRPLYRKLGLSPEQIKRFETAMAEHDWTVIDLQALARSQNVSESDSSFKKLRTAMDDKLAAELRETLGQENYERFRQYDESVRLRGNITDWIGGALYATETPLTGTQADALTEILRRHTDQSSRDQPDGPVRAEAEKIDWDAVMAEAPQVLDARQMSTLEAARRQGEWRTVFYAAIGAINGPPAAAPAGH